MEPRSTVQTDQTFLAVCTVRNEGAFLLEWLAWNRLIGFDRFLVFQNESEDDTKALLRLLAEHGLLEFLDNDGERYRSPQRYSYRRASQSDTFARADWAMALDVDEFPVIETGDGTLRDLVAACPADADAIRLSWRNFGHSGHVDLSDALVTERFTSCVSPEQLRTARIPTKALFRPSGFARLGVHSPKDPRRDGLKTYDGSGNLLPEDADVVGVVDPDGHRLGSVYHYMVKDVSNFVLKCDRGKSGHPDRAMKARYWKHWNSNAARNDRLARQSDRIRAEIDRIDAACGGRALPLQRSSAAWRAARLRQLLAQDDYLRIMRRICKLEGHSVPKAPATA